MSNRTMALTVVLDQEYRIEDDAQAIINAISQLKGAVSVTPNVSDMMQHVANNRARAELRDQISSILYPAPQKKHRT